MTALPKGVYGRDDLTKDQTLFADVVIVGSGAGGGTLAAELAEAGVDVIVLEEGSYNTEFDARPSHSIRRMYRDAGATMSVGNPPVLYQEGMTVGGSAVINGGMKWRTPENILHRWDVEDGLDRIGPKEMDFFFSRVENRINVALQDPESIGRDNALLKEGADKLGWDVIPNRRNQLHCAGSNNCAWGCPTHAKRSPIVTYIPRALHFGARIYANIRVGRILKKGKRAVGVEGRVIKANGKAGAKITVAGKLIVSSCGSIQTPALLNRSGFKSPSGQLGRNLSMHPNVKVIAIFDEDVRGWEGVHQAYQVRQFKQEGFVFAAVNIPPSIVAMTAPHYGRGLGAVMREYNKVVVAGLLLEDTSLGRVATLPGGNPLAFYQLNRIDFDKLRRGLELLCDLLFSVGAKRVLLPIDGIDEPTSPDEARAILARTFPRSALEVVTVHLMGTARMGVDRRWAVTDSYGMFHDAAGLMVCDASLFPSPIGVNPCLTIQALATRNAAHILENKKRYLQ